MSLLFQLALQHTLLTEKLFLQTIFFCTSWQCYSFAAVGFVGCWGEAPIPSRATTSAHGIPFLGMPRNQILRWNPFGGLNCALFRQISQYSFMCIRLTRGFPAKQMVSYSSATKAMAWTFYLNGRGASRVHHPWIRMDRKCKVFHMSTSTKSWCCIAAMI